MLDLRGFVREEDLTTTRSLSSAGLSTVPIPITASAVVGNLGAPLSPSLGHGMFNYREESDALSDARVVRRSGEYRLGDYPVDTRSNVTDVPPDALPPHVRRSTRAR